MMKRWVSLLLVMALLASLMVVPVYADDTLNLTTGDTALCPCGCGVTLAEVTWRVYDPNTDGAPSSGHYYLDGDYAQDQQYTIMAGDRVVLDLRGYTLTTAEASRLLMIYGRVHVLDTVGGGRFMAKTSGTAFGGVVMVSTNENNDALLELCSGTITVAEGSLGARRGGLIYLTECATFRMTGGILMGGSSFSQAYPDETGPGGSVAAMDVESTVEILGGKIIGGESSTYGGNIYSKGPVTLKNCHIVGGTAALSGGNIYATGKLTVENCTIESGVANVTSTGGGGNICATGGGTFSMKDSTVRNGWTSYHGGNIFLNTTSATIENSVVEAGVAKNRGNNLYGYKDCESLVIRDCQLPGDIAYTGAGLKLEGLVKIGLLNYGLRLRYGSDLAAPLDASGLSEGSEIFVNAQETFTTAGANPDYFKGCNRIVVTESAEGLVATIAKSGELGGYCPHCNQRVVWTAFDPATALVQECYEDAADGADTDPACTGSHLESGHYFLGKGRTDFKQLYVGVRYNLANIKDVVIDMSGYSITATGRAFYVRGDSAAQQQSTLTVLDSYGGSKITGSGSNNQPGGLVYNEGANVVIYGANWIYSPVTDRNITGGGIILNGNSVRMYGGTLDASAFTYTDASTSEKTYTYNGGCLMQYNATKCDFTMTAGRMIGGTVQAGGCAYFGYNNLVEITGGQFDSGISQTGSGGNIRMYGSKTYAAAQFDMSGAAVRDGRVEATETGGGNLSLGYGTINISDTYIAGGYAADYAGNMLIYGSSKMTFTDCVIADGYADNKGGNIHIAAYTSDTTWENCQILNGSGTYGGNVSVNHGNNVFKGGQILYGVARSSYGGNLYNNAGNFSDAPENHTSFVADSHGNVPLVAGGTAKTYGGNIYNVGVMDLQKVRICRGKAGTLGQDVLLNKGSFQSKLTVSADVTGEFSMGVASALLGSTVYGEPIDRTVCQELNADITLEGDYQGAKLCAKDGALYVGEFTLVDSTGAMTWYPDITSALAAYREDCFIQLYHNCQVELTRTVGLDLNGYAATVSGDCTVNLMDSRGGGTATLQGQTDCAEVYPAPDGVRYLPRKDGDVISVDSLDLQITGVSLRTSAMGIYYTGSWVADQAITGMVESYGITVSTAAEPDAGFMGENSTCMWTSQTDTLTTNSNISTSVLISGIMKTLEEDPQRTAAQNQANGETKIHAAAYVKLYNGTVILGDCVSYSLYDVLCMVDGLTVSDAVNYRKYTNPMREFYSKWEELGMKNWSFDMIQPPKSDEVIDLLMIGNSFCFYYVEELVAMAAADGIQMRVCNVYYSGCRLDQHYEWWQEGKAPYQFYETTVEGGRKGTNNVSLEWCLAQGNWDFISLQTPRFVTTVMETEIERNKLYMDTLVGYLRQEFPQAKMVWHQTWTYEIGTASNGVVTDEQSQLERHNRIRDYSLYACDAYDLIRVNTGDAWKILRDDGYRYLCARIGKGTNHEGDYYHDGDIGGGQYLNACVWYEVLTGNSCVGNAYRPVYKHYGTEIPLNSNMTYERLQQVAHQAVEQMRAEEAEN